MKKVYFITGSQDLYGEECLNNVAKDSKTIAKYLDKKIDGVKVEYIGIVRDENSCVDLCKKATNDPDCIAVITWMHTFSPAKMWIKGLQFLKKPLLHFHTQANEKLPYDEIDMDFMNLNQTAHGGREYGFMCTQALFQARREFCLWGRLCISSPESVKDMRFPCPSAAFLARPWIYACHLYFRRFRQGCQSFL